MKNKKQKSEELSSLKTDLKSTSNYTSEEIDSLVKFTSRDEYIKFTRNKKINDDITKNDDIYIDLINYFDISIF